MIMVRVCKLHSVPPGIPVKYKYLSKRFPIKGTMQYFFPNGSRYGLQWNKMLLTSKYPSMKMVTISGFTPGDDSNDRNILKIINHKQINTYLWYYTMELEN